MDSLVYLEEDVSTTTNWLPGTNVETLFANHGKKEGQVVGAHINGFSFVAPLSVVKALLRDQQRWKANIICRRLQAAWEGLLYG